VPSGLGRATPDYKAQTKTELKKIGDEVKKTEEEQARLVKIRKE